MVKHDNSGELGNTFNVVFFIRDRLVLIIGFLILAIPTVYSMSQSIWKTDDQAHGPIVLGMVMWIFWNLRNQLALLPEKSCWLGWLLIIISLSAYILGRSQEIWLFEVGSFIPFIGGLILLHKSVDGLKVSLFPLFFMLFIIPLPGFIVDSITGALKQQISNIAESILYIAGYPIARTGVTLTIGSYQLLVADACSGLHSMFSLFALGLFYINLQDYKSKMHNILIFIIIAPIAFFANIVRVITLVLVTYYFGDEAGQGFIHGAAGVFLFALALMSLYLVDLSLIKSTGMFKKSKI
jgi:exosortase B